jgi:hypothetical protein
MSAWTTTAHTDGLLRSVVAASVPPVGAAALVCDEID